jgi:membrane protein YqaA with SNARE-associated domain
MAVFAALYERVMRWSGHPHAERYLAALSFAESSFFPVPPDVMLAPMTLAAPQRWRRYAVIATLFSVLGGLAGYAIGYLLFESIEPWLRESHYWDAYLTARGWFNRYGIWAVFIAGFSPIPYKIFTIAAGVASLALPGFFLASLVGRGARFFLVAGVVRYAGPKVEARLLRYIERIGWGLVVLTLAVVGYLMMR